MQATASSSLPHSLPPSLPSHQKKKNPLFVLHRWSVHHLPSLLHPPQVGQRVQGCSSRMSQEGWKCLGKGCPYFYCFDFESYCICHFHPSMYFYSICLRLFLSCVQEPKLNKKCNTTFNKDQNVASSFNHLAACDLSSGIKTLNHIILCALWQVAVPVCPTFTERIWTDASSTTLLSSRIHWASARYLIVLRCRPRYLAYNKERLILQVKRPRLSANEPSVQCYYRWLYWIKRGVAIVPAGAVCLSVLSS